jgi:hypothetical protein
MTTTLLSSEQHLTVTVDTRAMREYGDLVNRSIAWSSEFNELHKEFPILLHKSGDTGEFIGHAILGLDKDENLFVEGDRWITSYIPATMARGPFSLGYVRRAEDDQQPPDIKVMIDDQHPRLRATGLPVFLQLGGEAPYLEGIKRVLQVIDAGMRVDKLLYPQLLALGLLEEVNIRVALSEETQYNFTGYYSVNQEKLAALNGEQLVQLNRSGLLGVVYFLISSLGNFQKLINLKNAKIQSA